MVDGDWLYSESRVLDPFYNLAWEEFILANKRIEDSILLFWKNKKSIILGRYQNIYEEVDLDFVKKKIYWLLAEIQEVEQFIMMLGI